MDEDARNNKVEELKIRAGAMAGLLRIFYDASISAHWRLYEGGFWKMKYRNPTWETYFKDISTTLSKLYFLTNSGTIRYIVATMIFKKMSFLEWRNEHWT